MLTWITFALTSLLAMVNPLSAVPMYLAVTADYSPVRQRQMLRRGILAAIIILAVFTMAGDLIMKFFGVTPTAFRLAGGAIFLVTGWGMMHADRSAEKTTVAEEEDLKEHHPEDLSIIPIATPLLAGPGSITLVVTLATRAHGLIQHVALYGAIVAVMLLSWAILATAPRIASRLGKTGLNIMTRLFGLLVLAIGMQFLADGVVDIATRVMSLH